MESERATSEALLVSTSVCLLVSTYFLPEARKWADSWPHFSHGYVVILHPELSGSEGSCCGSGSWSATPCAALELSHMWPNHYIGAKKLLNWKNKAHPWIRPLTMNMSRLHWSLPQWLPSVPIFYFVSIFPVRLLTIVLQPFFYPCFPQIYVLSIHQCFVLS